LGTRHPRGVLLRAHRRARSPCPPEPPLGAINPPPSTLAKNSPTLCFEQKHFSRSLSNITRSTCALHQHSKHLVLAHELVDVAFQKDKNLTIVHVVSKELIRFERQLCGDRGNTCLDRPIYAVILRRVGAIPPTFLLLRL